MKTITKNLFANGKIYLSKELEKVLQIKVGDPIGLYMDGNQIVLEKYIGTCLHCHNAKIEEDDDLSNETGVCFACRLNSSDKRIIAEKHFTIVKYPKAKLLNIPEYLRESIGFFVMKDKDTNKIINDKFLVDISIMRNKHKVLIKKAKTTN